MPDITFKEIIYNVKSLRQAGRLSQDSLLTDAHYAFVINQYRATLLGRDVDRRKALAPQVEQTLNAKFDRVRSMEQDVFADLHVYKVELPNVVQSSTRPLYQGVRSSMLTPSFPRSTANRIRYDVQDTLTGNMARYFPLEQSLYVVTPDPLQQLFVTAVFYDPLEVEIYKGKLNPFDPYAFEYPISGHTLDPLYKLMTDAEIKLSMISPNDIQADGQEEAFKQRTSPRTTSKTQDDDEQA